MRISELMCCTQCCDGSRLNGQMVFIQSPAFDFCHLLFSFEPEYLIMFAVCCLYYCLYCGLLAQWLVNRGFLACFLAFVGELAFNLSVLLFFGCLQPFIVLLWLIVLVRCYRGFLGGFCSLWGVLC